MNNLFPTYQNKNLGEKYLDRAHPNVNTKD